MSEVAIDKNNLPIDWRVLAIPEVLEKQSDGKVIHQGWSPRCHKEPSDSDDKWGVLKTTSIQPGFFDEVQNKCLPDHLEPRERIEVKKGDLLLTCAGPRNRCGIPCLIRSTRPRLMMSGKMYRFRANEDVVISKYLEAFLLSSHAQYEIDRMKTGGNESGLNLTHGRFKKLLVPVAPIEQQKRIVAKIEELFSHIDAGIEALKKAKQLLKQYRQSVLKAAVTGELTKEWREANKDKLEPASQLLERILKERRQKWEEQQLEQFKAKGKMPKDDKWKVKYKEPHTAEYEGEMPIGWIAVTASQLAEHIVDGTHHTPKYVDQGIDFVSAKNINDWEVDYIETKKITKEEHEELIKRCHPKKGDVLLTKSGTLGRAAVVKDDHIFSVFESVAVFPVLDKSISDYIVLAIHEAAMGDAGRKIQKGIAVKHLHLEDLRKMEFLLPSKPEIEEIVRVFENVTSASFRLAKELEVKLLQAEKAKQSVLSSAFSGRLRN